MNKVDRSRLTNLERLRKLVEESGFDAVLATSLENVTYTSGFYSDSIRTLTDHMYIAIWPAEGKPAFISPSRRVGTDIFIEDVRAHDFYIRKELLKDPRGRSLVVRSPIPLLAEVLREKGLAAGRIGIEKMHFPVMRYEELKELMPSAEFVDCGSLFDEARMVKTAAEIELLQSAGIATEKAIQTGFALARPGNTGRSVANSIGNAIVKLGADSVSFLHVEVGGRRLKHEYLEAPVELKEGDPVRVDAGGFFAGYYSDVARMAVVGEPSAEQRSLYHRLLAVQRKVINEIMKPGRSGREMLQLTGKACEKFGLKPNPSNIAHGLGLFVHERPWLREAEMYELQPGMVLCVEIIKDYQDPPFEDQMWQLEDLIVITKEGAQKLTTYSSTDDLFVIG